MAGNRMNNKSKGKEDRNKNSKTIGRNSEDSEEPDFALLRKPIPTSITSFGQARKIFDLATEELKGLLTNECDLLYECKVCRNLFRSLANFISHKRVYCKAKFNTSEHNHFIKQTSIITELLKINHVEQGYQESLKETNEPENKEEDERIPMTKDLTAVIEKITNNKGSCESNSDEPQIALQKIPNTAVAVFQNVGISEEKQADENMKSQVTEMNDISSRDVAVLQRDGNFVSQNYEAVEYENVIQISDDEDNDITVLKCKICDMQFSTQKTLKFHMKYKHVESRLVYPCPECLELFSTSWSVYRHLFKVHRKTAAQIRRLRESIQTKAFKMNNPPAFYEKRKNNMKANAVAAKKISEEERIDRENQAWMDNLEIDGGLPRCGGCGRTFERRAALVAHTHTCPPRLAAARAAARRPPDAKRIEIQIRKDYNKGPPILNLPAPPADSNENKSSHQDIIMPLPMTAIKEELDDDQSETREPEDASEDDKSNKSNDATNSPQEEIQIDISPQVEVPKLNIRLPLAHQTEKNNQVTFRQKIKAHIELNNLLCKRCNTQFSEVQELFDHMADHLKWVRFACKLCNFKSYAFEKLPEHVKVVHKLKGDKDFYYSTVKAIDGTEASELCENLEELPDANETSPESRRPSRCSSDSSRLSDDSSSSCTRVESSRKRKIYLNKRSIKKRRESMAKGEDSRDGDVSQDKTATITESTSSSMKSFEDNSSDMEVDLVDNISNKKEIGIDVSVASRRPVRRKIKPKNEDFEYDLSNLLKMEAQGYRDALVMQANAKTNQSKKKIQLEIQNYENLNRDCCGALMAMTKKCVEKSAAHIKTSSSSFYPPKEAKPPNVFLRPMLPKTISKGDKASPKKDTDEDSRETSSPVKERIINKVVIPVPTKKNDSLPPVNNELPVNNTSKTEEPPENKEASATTDVTKKTVTEPSGKLNSKEQNNSKEQSNSKEQNTSKVIEMKKPISIPPIKLRRQSIDVMKNPLLNKNISDFTKAGMKTKILVIKPINRNKDGTQTMKTPLKFQTIKLKDPSKSSSNEDKLSDQVVVVKVPTVECAIARPTTQPPTPSPAENPNKSERVPLPDTPAVLIPNDSRKSITVEENSYITPVPLKSEASDEPKSIYEDEACEFSDEDNYTETNMVNTDTLKATNTVNTNTPRGTIVVIKPEPDVNISV